MVRPLYQQVAALQSAALGPRHKLLHYPLLLQVFHQVGYLVVLRELLAVVVGVLIAELQQQSRHGCLFIIRGVVGGVLGYEDVGRDAATAVDLAANARLVGRTRVVDAVLREELAVLVAYQEVFLVVLVLSAGVGLLYAAARGRVVAGDGQPHQRAVVKLDGLLHQALAERATPDDGAAVVVLDGTGENLRG